jgi:hypothetical protein
MKRAARTRSARLRAEEDDDEDEEQWERRTMIVQNEDAFFVILLQNQCQATSLALVHALSLSIGHIVL